MDVFEAIRARRSVRRYKPRPVEREKLERILEAGRLAPSAANRQPWHFVVVTDPSVRDELVMAHERDQFFRSTGDLLRAPVVIVACADRKRAWVRRDGEEYWKVDVAIAMQNMVLCATEEGLGTCWIGAFSPEATRKILGIPDDIRIVAITPLGYPDESPATSDRRTMQEIVHYQHW
ncbi:nitroreductase family protein [Candidatus Bathyarchaeota archaeon]|nr:nitroreductase family protein [Candidatus Bathyarchaeota archaeon]